MSKVFAIGFHKTGTTTLGAALAILKYKVCGPRIELAKSLMKGDYGAVFSIAGKYDAFQDNPWPVLYKEMDERFPGSKFILVIREDEAWLNSVVNFFKDQHADMREWIYGVGGPLGNEEIYLQRYQRHNREVQAYFKNRPDALLVLRWEDGIEWSEICAFLGKDIPDVSFPHKNKGTDERESFFIRNLKDKLKAIYFNTIGKRLE